jgi:hypothetical protein
MIPKIIWQCNFWPYDKIPNHIKLHSKQYQDLNPNFEYRYVSDSQMADDMYKYAEIYDSIIYKFWLDPKVTKRYKSDLWRALCLYEHGGVFFDSDTQSLFKLNEDYFYEYKILISTIEKNENTGVMSIANGAIAIEKESKILLSYIYFMIETIKYYYEEGFQDIWDNRPIVTKSGDIGWWETLFPLGATSWTYFFNMVYDFFNSNNLKKVETYKIKEYFLIKDITSIESAKDFKYVISNGQKDLYPLLHGDVFKFCHFKIEFDDNSYSIGNLQSIGSWNFK